jgi:hypothetical protein
MPNDQEKERNEIYLRLIQMRALFSVSRRRYFSFESFQEEHIVIEQFAPSRRIREHADRHETSACSECAPRMVGIDLTQFQAISFR